jgi:Endomembrane protein 70
MIFLFVRGGGPRREQITLGSGCRVTRSPHRHMRCVRIILNDQIDLISFRRKLSTNTFISLLQLRMKEEQACIVLCKKNHKKSEIAMFKQMIDQEYRVHWLLDNLPVAVRNDELGYVSRGYPVGFVAATPKSQKPLHYLFNHVRIIVRYSEEEAEFSGARIVGFEVVPFSIKVTSQCKF